MRSFCKMSIPKQSAIMPDGSCDAECTPTLEEQIRACDEQLASGEINAIEHYICVMGPGGPGEQWETCFATVWDFNLYFKNFKNRRISKKHRSSRKYNSNYVRP